MSNIFNDILEKEIEINANIEKSPNSFNARIINPLSGFHYYLDKIELWDKKYVKRGLALCHGHNQWYRPLCKIRFIDHWYLVDADYETRPDYIADITNDDEMKYFPDKYFDCVLSVYCPYGAFPGKIFIVLKTAHRILRDNGVLVMSELMGLFYHFIGTVPFDKIVDEVKKYISDEYTMASLKSQYLQTYGNDKIDREFYNELFAGNFDYDNKDVVMKVIKKYAKKYAKELLAKNQFRYIGKKGGNLFAKKA